MSFARKVCSVIVAVVLLGITLVSVPERALALSGSEFDPGYIISDQKFFDSNSMTETQIQDFLTSKGGTCSAGYTCLKDYRISTFTRPAVEPGHCSAYIGAADERASTIIYKAAQACGISPQTLLVLLQKETSLVTSTSPTAGTYRKATGYGCPDTSVCEAAFYGFYNQVYKAAWQFRQYSNYPNRQYKIGNVSVGFHPNAACGSSVVNIRNQATANLYNYTPYQPNGPALANLGGSGDGCSSYGNRNFWVFFNNWFGNPVQVVPPLWSIDMAEMQKTSTGAALAISGWVIDQTQASVSIPLHVYLDRPDGTTVGYPYVANGSRTDVGAAYPTAGSNHGFSATIPISTAGAYRACLFAIQTSGGYLLDCRSFNVLGATPGGYLDFAQGALAGGVPTVSVGGWAFDSSAPTTTSRVDIYLDQPSGKSLVQSVQASSNRPDVGSAFPVAGAAHGFATSFPVQTAGLYRACAYAIGESILGANSAPLGCQMTTIGASQPYGALDTPAVTYVDGQPSIAIAGWAIDATWRTTPLEVHVYIDRPNGTSTGTALVANVSRPDVGLVYPSAGALHGYAQTFPVTAPGTYRMCAYGIGSSPFGNANVALGCNSIVVAGTTPFGVLDSVSASTQSGTAQIAVSGWAMDSATPAVSIPVHVYVDRPDGTSSGIPITANVVRTDVAAAYPGYGAAHGFTLDIPVTKPGVHRICVYPITQTVLGANGNLGCRSVTIG